MLLQSCVVNRCTSLNLAVTWADIVARSDWVGQVTGRLRLKLSWFGRKGVLAMAILRLDFIYMTLDDRITIE